jgi:nucleoside-diphosphate-sugar epimerase
MNKQNKRIVVTGGAGFLGSHVVEELKTRGYDDVVIPRSSEYDLRHQSEVSALMEDTNPDIVLHAAATVGGIGLMRKKPGDIFYDNSVMGLELIEQSRRHDVDKFVVVGSVCAYPKNTPIPFDEENLWNGYPEETHAPYGIAKKLPLVQIQAYKHQYDFNGIYLLPVNLYGPRDDFDPETSHVIPAIIRKVDAAIRSDEDSIVAWGTGEPTREFLYIEDAAEAVVESMESYDKSLPVNLGSGEEISIRELIYTISDKMGFEGNIMWDESKPDGQPRRCLDTSRARKEFGWSASTDFEDGLSNTIDWYYDNRDEIVGN